MTTLNVPSANPKSSRKVVRKKSFGRITSVEGKRIVWSSTVSGRAPSQATKGDSAIGRSRFDD